jgi:putative GTP pyrophosphokinase
MLNLDGQYQFFSEGLQTVCSRAISELPSLLVRQGIGLAVPIEVRAKRWDSLERKITMGVITPRHLFDVQDLIGIRIVVLYQRDIAKAISTIQDRFVIKRIYSTQNRLADDQFGYSSNHVVLKAPHAWMPDNATPLMRDRLLAEIQVRTLAQHLWALVSHDLQYKREVDAPPELRRSLARTSALLESVDLEMERLLTERAQYVESLECQPEEEPLNVDSLAATLDRVWPVRNRLTNEPYAMLLNDLIRKGIDAPAKLKQVLSRHQEDVLVRSAREAEQIRSAAELAGVSNGEIRIQRENATVISTVTPELLEKVKKGIFYGHCALTWLAMKFESGEVSPEDPLSHFRS